MKNKQIMIDGVDVSGCGYYDPNADKESYFLHDCKKEHAPCWSCVSMPSCLYKKYKRKEQECERLTSTLTEIKEIAEENDELLQGYHKEWANNKLILQKISEVEDETDK